ncbi:MAG TPA: CoA-binding protein [Actinomycetota bacterium]|nr:CoA-binding protein [Actinomycetota bacterium]
MDTVRILEQSDTVAVVGFSADPAKSAHSIPVSLKRSGYRVVPVNPNCTEVAGERSYPSLRDVPHPIDLVVVFRPAEEAPGIARQAVEVGAKALWLQSGLRSPEARRIATEAGLGYVEDRCTAVERSVHGIRKLRSG